MYPDVRKKSGIPSVYVTRATNRNCLLKISLFSSEVVFPCPREDLYLPARPGRAVKSVQILQLTGGPRGTTVSIATKKIFCRVHIGQALADNVYVASYSFGTNENAFEGKVIHTQNVCQYAPICGNSFCCQLKLLCCPRLTLTAVITGL